MTQYPYWRQQTLQQPLFPEIEWNRPERRDQAGRLAIIGGNALGFVGAAEAYRVAIESGAGSVRVILPDALRKTVPPHMSDVLFADTNPSGGLSRGAESELRAVQQWADGLLYSGDAGKNSETASLYETMIGATDRPTVLTRDAIDLMQHAMPHALDNPHLILVASFAQVQKLFRAVYYPKLLTFRMQLSQFVEVLHKFTITYPITIAVLHAEHFVIAQSGQVVTQPWDAPLAIWRGEVAARVATYLLWSPGRPLEATCASLCYTKG